MAALKLSTITDPSFELELPGGEVKSFDLWKALNAVQDAISATPPATLEAAISAACGFEYPGYVPSFQAALTIWDHIQTLAESVPEVKKGLARSAKLSGSTASNQTNG